MEFETEFFGEIPLFWQDSYWNQFDKKSFFKIQDNFVSFWTINHGVLQSGFSSPFGGFWPSRDEIGVNSQDFFLHFQKILEIANDKNISKLEVRLPPAPLYPANVKSQELLLGDLGFSLKYSETDHYLDLRTDPHLGFNRNRTRDIKKFDLDYKFSQVGIENLPIVFEILSKNRALNNVPQNLTLPNLQILSECAPGKLALFLVKVRTGSPIAAALCMNLDESITYVSQWGDIQRLFSQELGSSPMAGLASGIFRHFKNSRKNLIYLGTSSLKGLLDPGLSRFKESIGSESSTKNIWEKVLI